MLALTGLSEGLFLFEKPLQCWRSCRWTGQLRSTQLLNQLMSKAVHCLQSHCPLLSIHYFPAKLFHTNMLASEHLSSFCFRGLVFILFLTLRWDLDCGTRHVYLNTLCFLRNANACENNFTSGKRITIVMIQWGGGCEVLEISSFRSWVEWNLIGLWFPLLLFLKFLHN